MTIKREWSYEADPELWSAGDADQRTSYNSCVHQRRGQGKGHKALNALCFCLQYSFVTIFLIVPFSFWFWLKNWKIFFPKVLLFKCVKSWGSLDTNGESHNLGDGTGISREMKFLRPNLWVKIYLFRRVIGRKVKKIKLLVKKKSQYGGFAMVAAWTEGVTLGSIPMWAVVAPGQRSTHPAGPWYRLALRV